MTKQKIRHLICQRILESSVKSESYPLAEMQYMLGIVGLNNKNGRYNNSVSNAGYHSVTFKSKYSPFALLQPETKIDLSKILLFHLHNV